MADEHNTSRPHAASTFTVEHDQALHSLKQHGSAVVSNPEEERILADIAAAGFAEKKGNAYVYTGTSAKEPVNPTRAGASHFGETQRALPTP